MGKRRKIVNNDKQPKSRQLDWYVLPKKHKRPLEWQRNNEFRRRQQQLLQRKQVDWYVSPKHKRRLDWQRNNDFRRRHWQQRRRNLRKSIVIMIVTKRMTIFDWILHYENHRTKKSRSIV